MRLIYHVLKLFINKFLVVYFDDILVYRKMVEEYMGYLQKVFDVFLWERLFDYLNKCSFYVEKLIFLWFV